MSIPIPSMSLHMPTAATATLESCAREPVMPVGHVGAPPEPLGEAHCAVADATWNAPGDGPTCRIRAVGQWGPASGVHQAHTYIYICKVKWSYLLSITICGDAPAGSIERRPASTKIDRLLPDVI